MGIIGGFSLISLCDSHCFGHNQFAYQKGRGARDAIAHLVLSWICVFNRRRKVGLYCSDVAGAFDRVKMERLVEKLRAAGLHPNIVALLESWLRRCSASVIVGGASSEEFALFNMVYQGTVFGPILWNVFFQDSKFAHEHCPSTFGNEARQSSSEDANMIRCNIFISSILK